MLRVAPQAPSMLPAKIRSAAGARGVRSPRAPAADRRGPRPGVRNRNKIRRIQETFHSTWSVGVLQNSQCFHSLDAVRTCTSRARLCGLLRTPSPGHTAQTQSPEFAPKLQPSGLKGHSSKSEGGCDFQPKKRLPHICKDTEAAVSQCPCDTDTLGLLAAPCLCRLDIWHRAFGIPSNRARKRYDSTNASWHPCTPAKVQKKRKQLLKLWGCQFQVGKNRAYSIDLNHFKPMNYSNRI